MDTFSKRDCWDLAILMPRLAYPTSPSEHYFTWALWLHPGFSAAQYDCGQFQDMQVEALFPPCARIEWCKDEVFL